MLIADEYHTKLLEAHQIFTKLLCKAESPDYKFKQQRAYDYYVHGLCRRAMIIRRNLNYFITVIPPTRKNTLNYDDISETTMHINSFYINLYGCLDNIAWMILYELNMFNCQNKEEAYFKFKVDLFKNEFLNEIGQIDEIFANFFHTKKSWYINLKTYRHPSAHRFPLYIVPQVFSKPEDVQHFYELREKSLMEACNRNFEESKKLIKKQQSIGVFPHLMAHDLSQQPTVLYPTIFDDCFTLDEIVGEAFKLLERLS